MLDLTYLYFLSCGHVQLRCIGSLPVFFQHQKSKINRKVNIWRLEVVFFCPVHMAGGECLQRVALPPLGGSCRFLSWGGTSCPLWVGVLEVSVISHPFFSPQSYRTESMLLAFCKFKICWKITVSYWRGTRMHLCVCPTWGCLLPLTPPLVSHLGPGAVAPCGGARDRASHCLTL